MEPSCECSRQIDGQAACLDLGLTLLETEIYGSGCITGGDIKSDLVLAVLWTDTWNLGLVVMDRIWSLDLFFGGFFADGSMESAQAVSQM